MAAVDRLQGLSGDLAVKTPVRVTTTAAITLSGLQTIDGVTLVADDRVLVKDQADTTANGIYVASISSWTRALDCNGANDLVNGTLVVTSSGTTNSGKIFRCNGTNPITPGTSAITFSALLSADAAASSVSNTPSGNISSTDVQSAINELDSEKQPLDAQLTTLAGITAQQATDLAAVSTFIGTLLDDADAATARTTLGVESSVQIQQVGASVAANALTQTLDPTTLDFRSTTLTSGAVNTRTVAAQISLVISSGSTLGTVNAIAARLAILAIDNAGTVELAVSNLAGGVNLDETTLISTTAEGGAGAADSATAIYSTTARTNVPFRVVGFIDITEATAGTWATAPTLVQGVGGQALVAMSSIGYGQTWQNVTASRALATTYTNTTGKPIQIRIEVSASTAGQLNLTTTISSITVGSSTYYASAAGFEYQDTFIVPPGGTYSASIAGSSGTPTISLWTELR